MIGLYHIRKRIAIGMLAVLLTNILLPFTCYALTSGPVEPETQAFQPAGVSDMVNLQNGSFKYNIPLLDIDGYPINLSYESGSGIDDESSWVGFGWSLNPGAINRQVRGLPDDFDGDTVQTDHYVKPEVTVGGSVNAKYEITGIALGGTSTLDSATSISGSVSLGIFNNNYTGIGAEIGANAGISSSFVTDGILTAQLGLGINSNTQTGASITPSVNLSIADHVNETTSISSAFSASLGYNSRSGLKSLTMGTSFGVDMLSGKRLPNPAYENDPSQPQYNDKMGGMGGDASIGSCSIISYNTEPINPSIQIPFTTSYNSFSFNVGPAYVGQFPSLGGSGYRSVRQVANVVNIKKGYGFLYAEKGKNNPGAVMDFIREKDNPIVQNIPNIALPINTPDLWSFTNQLSSGQFRFYRGGSGAFFDNQETDQAIENTDGFDLGVGSYFHGGLTLFKQSTTNRTNKWTINNAYLAKGDFQDTSANPGREQVFFRLTGEKGLADQELNTQVYGTQPLAVNTTGLYANAAFTSNTGSVLSQQTMAKTSRRQNTTVISYLTAQEAQYGALDTAINIYPFNSATTNSYPAHPVIFSNVHTHRVDGTRKPNHISEITVTDGEGKRMVYGIPVYNLTQDEYTFAVGATGRTGPGTYPANNQVAVPANVAMNNLGIDNYYQRDHKGSYATSYLLTAILSPDYVDKTGNGISDDDPGTAVKFNYSKLPYRYKWRTPYQKATLNKGLLADPDDDKGSIIYGEKEIYYVQSIETKTKIAYFITAARSDGLGVAGWQNGGIDPTNQQKCLQQIRLYSKADMSRPIKVVNFQYSYALCPGVPNNSSGGGKLTLTKVWFDYGNSDKGQYFPYTFSYNTVAGGVTVPYGYMVTDRWGTYKNASENTNGLSNDLYPYTDQNTSVVNQNVGLWQLSQVALPTGGTISVSYESGDYAYVQNKKAMVMSAVSSLVDASGHAVSSTQLRLAHGLSVSIGTVTIPAGTDTTQWFKDNYLDGSGYMYTKLYVQIATGLSNSQGCNYDFVPCYAQVKKVILSGSVAEVIFNDMNTISTPMNPISIAAWQSIKNQYPRYAYAGFDNRLQSASSSITAAIMAILNAAKNLTELTQNFYQKAYSNNYAGTVDLTKSFVKLTNTTGHKLGGPARVSKIKITDNWKTMSGNNIANATYGQSYNYTTTESGQVISSGVATYEPYVGNDENALKQPVPYTETIKGALSNYYDIEQPFGESLFPAPEITYSKVTVQDLDQTGNPSTQTGSIVNEFYTSKDFPVRVTVLPISSYHYRPASQYSLTSTNSIDQMCLSQGYSIELNDMNGKEKAVHVLNQSGSEISSTVYNYKETSNGTLDNHATIIGPDGTVTANQVIGQEIEFFTDFREQVSNNTGNTINIGGDVFPVPFPPTFFGLPHNPYNTNNELKTFRSACAVKVIQDYGLLDNVVKTENGSSITTQNIAYDGFTGEPMVTRTQNEFEKTIYSVNLPAYWGYKGMSGAYQNQGIYLLALKTSNKGVISSAYASYLKGGDVLLSLDSGKRYWVNDNSGIAGAPAGLRLIDSAGSVKTTTTAKNYKIIRSGFRNMISASMSSVVCLNNPLVTTGSVTSLQLKLNTDLTSLKVINASATSYDESWSGQPNCTQSYAPRPIDTVTSFNSKIFPGSYDQSYSMNGASIRRPTGMDTINTAAYWKSTLGRCGIWVGSTPTGVSPGYPNVGLVKCITVATSRNYYFGYGADNIARIYIDGVRVDTTNSFSYWYIRPYFLTAGSHVIMMAFVNTEDIATGGLEVYADTLQQLEKSTITGTTNIFTTQSLINNTSSQTFIGNGLAGSTFHYVYADNHSAIVNPCFPDFIKLPIILNPYTNGFLGNWRPYQTKVFQQSRYDRNLTDATRLGADLKNAGTINSFYSYWYYGSGGWTPNTTATKWITANTVTLYDKYGQQLENKDALGRYSAAKFDFNGELPGAVASNAMNREIYEQSFEDSKFTFGTDVTDTCYSTDFAEPSTGYVFNTFSDSTISHSGNYSAKLPYDGVKLGTKICTLQQKTVPYLVQDTLYRYMSKTDVGLNPAGFQPSPNKSYIFDAWIYDGTVNNNTVTVSLLQNGTVVPLKCRAVVEGWKLVEGTINIGNLSSGTAMSISIVPNAGYSINIDDVRINPFNAQVKTYAYDAKTMRLMAEMDENGFATFYEYDDEGLLIRVKKETEKGIMTLKESRSSYKHN